jgi:hypothetical protein
MRPNSAKRLPTPALDHQKHFCHEMQWKRQTSYIKLQRQIWKIPYLCVYKPHFFDKNLLSKIQVQLFYFFIYLFKLDPPKKKKPLSFGRLSPRRRYWMLWNPQYRPLVFETVILQAIAHARRHQHITGISAYFDYMRVTNTIDSQKLEDSDITDKLP